MGRLRRSNIRITLWLLFSTLMQVFSSVYGVINCEVCEADKTCILEDPIAEIQGGESFVIMQLCNYKEDIQYSIQFSLALPLLCDINDATTPVLQGDIKILDSKDCGALCTVVQVPLTSPIDWAIAMKSGEDINVLSAQLMNADGVDTSKVMVARGYKIEGPELITSSLQLSTCTSSVKIKGKYLSSVASCNALDLCSNSNSKSSTVCEKSLVKEQSIVNVQCEGEDCEGELELPGLGFCEVDTGISGEVVAAVQVGKSKSSSFTSLGTISSPSILGIDKLESGSDSITILTNAVNCVKPSTFVFTILNGPDDLMVQDIVVSNSTIRASLSAGIPESYSHKELQFQVYTCGAQSSSLPFPVIVDEDNASKDKLPSNENYILKPEDSALDKSYQQSGSPNGFDYTYAVYAGVAIGIVAFIGFCAERLYHKRHLSLEENHRTIIP